MTRADLAEAGFVDQSFIATPVAALRFIAETPKQGEPEPGEPQYRQDWEEDSGRYAIETLHNLINVARAALTKAGEPFDNA